MSIRRIVLLTVLFFSLIGTASAQVRPQMPGAAELNGKSMDQWIKEIDDPDPSVREQAIKMTAMFGPAAKKAMPSLIRQLNMSNDLSPLTNAAIAIGLIVPDDPRQTKDAVEGLTRLLDSTQGIIKFQAATALGNIGLPARSATPRLVRLIKDQSSWEIRKATAFALGRIGRDDSNFPDIRALIALVDGIDDHSKEVRIESLQGLISLGPPASPQDQLELKRRLEKRVKTDKDMTASIWCRVALMMVDPTAVNDANLNFFGNLLKSSEPSVPGDAAKALGALGSAAKTKIPQLIELLNTSADSYNLICTCWALGRMGADAKGAIDALESRNKSHTDPNVKQAAADAIKEINKPKK